jgi:hypothetical protein
MWLNFKNTLRHNIIADVVNKDLLVKNKMRQKLVNRKDLGAIKLPQVFLTKKLRSKDI